MLKGNMPKFDHAHWFYQQPLLIIMYVFMYVW